MAPLKILNNSLFSYIYIFMCAFLSFFRIKTTNQTMHCNVQFPWRFCESLASLTARKAKFKNEVLQMQSKRKVLKLLGKWLWNVKMQRCGEFCFHKSCHQLFRGCTIWQWTPLCVVHTVFVLLHHHLVSGHHWYAHCPWFAKDKGFGPITAPGFFIAP